MMLRLIDLIKLILFIIGSASIALAQADNAAAPEADEGASRTEGERFHLGFYLLSEDVNHGVGVVMGSPGIFRNYSRTGVPAKLNFVLGFNSYRRENYLLNANNKAMPADSTQLRFALQSYHPLPYFTPYVQLGAVANFPDNVLSDKDVLWGAFVGVGISFDYRFAEKLVWGAVGQGFFIQSNLTFGVPRADRDTNRINAFNGVAFLAGVQMHY